MHINLVKLHPLGFDLYEKPLHWVKSIQEKYSCEK